MSISSDFWCEAIAFSLNAAPPPTASPTAKPRPRNGNREANRPGFTTAQQWDPSLPHFDLSDRFAPTVRANELAKAAKTQSTP